MARVLQAEGDPKRIVFSGVGKQSAEIVLALQAGIKCFNVESEAELFHLNELAKKHNFTANISLRINPNIDANTHPHIATGLHENKFGIAVEKLPLLLEQIKTLTHVNLIGIACHLGSQIMELTPFGEAIDCVLNLAAQCKQAGFALKQINLGGGLGVSYQNEKSIEIKDYVRFVLNKISSYPYEVILEPGRAIVANAGILLTRIHT